MDRSTLPHIGVIVRANQSIGTGHLMRIKPLLPKLKEHAYLTLYVYAFDEALRPLCSEYDKVQTFETKEDILCHLQFLKAKTQSSVADERLDDLFIIDDYAIDKDFEQELYTCAKLFIIDDLCNREHSCHILLDQTLFTREEGYQKLCPPECKLLLGAPYSLTLERFYVQNYMPDYHSPCTCGAHHGPVCARTLENAPYQGNCTGADSQCQPVPRVLVNFGGADPVSACLQSCRTIIDSKLYEQYHFTVLAGAANKDYPRIQELLQTIPQPYQERMELIAHCNDVADLLFKHDIAIGAYGGMFRERIAAAIPTLGVEIADNQAGAGAIVEHFKLGLSLELEQLKDSHALKSALSELLYNGKFYSDNCRAIYDGQGLNRIAHELLALLKS